VLHFLHAAVTRWRRAHAHPRRLNRPVISIGNIAAGGRAKTPMTAIVARLLLEAGERPAILSRGYARANVTEAPVIVRDAAGVRASLADAGDEPLMLAERLDGAIVVVHGDRARGGAVAERLGATVHILDDGFQHLRVARDLDIVMVEPGDLGDGVMPSGRLREPVEALAHADAVVMVGGFGVPDRVYSTGKSFGGESFGAARRVVPPPGDLAGQIALLVSGLADNAQFAWSVTEAGWRAGAHASFRDHHRYTVEDAARIARDAREAGAAFVLTSAKDAVRLREVWTDDLPLHIAELELELDRPDDFARWLIDGVTHARAARADADRRARQDGPRRAS